MEDGSQIHTYGMLFSSDSVIQYYANSWDSLYNPIYTEYARGIFKILPDTSFVNTFDSTTYKGKHIKIHVWRPNFPDYSLIKFKNNFLKKKIII